MKDNDSYFCRVCGSKNVDPCKCNPTIEVHFFKPIAQSKSEDQHTDRSVEILASSCSHQIAQPMSIREVEGLVRDDKGDEVLEELVKRYESNRAGDEEIVSVGAPYLSEGMRVTRMPITEQAIPRDGAPL